MNTPPADPAGPAGPAAGDGEGLAQLLSSKEVVVFAGSGGVGKTTTAAAAGLMAASELGIKVLVLTIDPARRLANAMGLAEVGNAETQVAPSALAAAGVRPGGELWVAMLDTKASWDDLIERHAPSVAVRDRILANSIYANISARFVQSHDYIAMERLYELHASRRYDLVIVDTPPSRNAIDFLEAPARMADFFRSRLLRWLTAPSRSRLLTLASRPFYEVADRILGSQFLGDIAEFFGLFQMMERGFVERAEAVSRVLADRRTTFVVVTTPEDAPVAEAEFFLDALRARRLHLGAVVVNRTLASSLRDERARRAADRLGDDAERIAAQLAADGVGDPGTTARVLAEVARNFCDLAVAAGREVALRQGLQPRADVVVEVPWFAGDVADLASLAVIGDHLRRG